jgi:hypothetical protein
MDTGGTLLRLYGEAEAAADTPAHTDNSLVGKSSALGHMPTGLAGETVSVEMLSLSGETISVPINRRSFVGGAAGFPAVLFLGGAPEISPHLGEGNLSDVLKNMRQMRKLLSAQDNTFGPGTVLPTAVHQVSILQRLSTASRSKARDDLMSLQSAYGEFCGWLADDLGDPRTGQHWIDRALDWGHESGDSIQTGYVLMRKAQRAADAGDSAAAVGLARAAVRPGGLPPRVIAAAKQYEAQGHALNGDRDAFQQAIDAAHGIVADIRATDQNDGWAVWCTPAYVAVHEAAGLMRLNSPEIAAAKYEEALRGWSEDMQRDLGIYRSRAGMAFASARDPEPAVTAGRDALAIAKRTGSGRILAELGPLAVKLHHWRSNPVVGDFLTEFRAAVAARTTAPNTVPEMGGS